MINYKKELVKSMIIIVFLIIYYYVSNFVKLNYSNKQNYIPYYIWTYIWTLILVIIFSLEHFHTIIKLKNIKINFIFLCLALCMLSMYIPNTPFFNFILKGQSEFLILIFWYSVIHSFQKT